MNVQITIKMKVNAFGMKRLPTTLRRFWATSGNWFWQPCPVCNKEFGGHENSHVTIPLIPLDELPTQKQIDDFHKKHDLVYSIRESICPCCAIELIQNKDTRLRTTFD